MSKIFYIKAAAIASVAIAATTSDLSGQVSNSTINYMDQGWSAGERQAWYAATQGSRLMPAVWFRALERAEDDMLFLDSANMQRFRFLIDETNPKNPYPIGFAEDVQPDRNFAKTRLRWFGGQGNKEAWVGLNCAACHTAELHMGAQKVRVDGGPSVIDFQGFDEEVAKALRRTLDDDLKFDRFAARVLGKRAKVDGDLLRRALGQLTVWRETVIAANATDMRYGFARLDAFGHIFNQVALFAGADKPTVRPSDAPVSYPFLWNTPQHDIVQWNGIASNGKPTLGVSFNAMGRNAGEVIGVFGEVNVKKRSGSRIIGKRAYSSVYVDNLEKMEAHVARLKSPRWPSAIFGSLDAEKVKRGADLFQVKCSGCHKPLASDAINQPVVAQMSRFLPIAGEAVTPPPETDPAMACRSYERRTATGFYKGVSLRDEKNNKRVAGDEEPLSDLLAAMVKSALLDQAGELVGVVTSVASGEQRDLWVNNPGDYSARSERVKAGLVTSSRGKSVVDSIEDIALVSPVAVGGVYPASRDWGAFTACMTTNPSKLKSYKARPLNGIWATAPYLHNGAVPNLYELLLPPARRSPEFYVGTRSFDTKHVGYSVALSGENSFHFRTKNDDGTVRWGNYNGGHDYGNDALTNDQRWDLVEYMKSL